MGIFTPLHESSVLKNKFYKQNKFIRVLIDKIWKQWWWIYLHQNQRILMRLTLFILQMVRKHV